MKKHLFGKAFVFLLSILNLTITLILILFIFKTENALSYTVKKGEWLADIVRKNIPGEVFGENANLTKIKKLNPEIKDFDLISPGQKIELGLKEETEAPISTPPAQPVKIEPVKTEPLKIEAVNPTTPAINTIGLITNAKFVEIKGVQNNGTSGRLVSDLSYGIGLEWGHGFGKLFTSYLGFLYQPVTFTESSSITLESRNQYLNQYYLELTHEFNSVLSTQLKLSDEDEIFYRTTTQNSAIIEKVTVPSIALGARYDFLNALGMNFAIKGNYRIHLPFQNDYYTSKMGRGYKGVLLVEKQFSSFSIFGELFYSKDVIPIEPIDFNSSDLGVQLGLRYQF